MDIDLFQGILLGLLAVGLIVLIALLSTLGGIRKALERASSTPTPGEAAPAREPVAETPVEAAPQAREAATPAQAEVEPAAAAVAATPSAQETPDATEQDDQAATIRAVLSQHGVAGATTTEPSAEVAEPASVVAAHIDSDEPEEEPFQRDGRWWFKRGGELLVYDEGAAQWVPAERPSHWSGGAPAATPTTTATPAATSTTSSSSPTGAATAATAPQPAVTSTGSGWKCGSCGAINGSTATSCRMCFTARP